MRCARHPYEGGVGVCAPCLRDRLLALAAAQNAASSLPPPLPPPPEPPEPVLFPRSVSSPYVCPRRKSDASSAPRGRPPGSHLLFFRTPQVGPASGAAAAAGFEDGDIGLFRRRRTMTSRFSVLAAFFGHRRPDDDDDKRGDKERRRYMPSSSWLAGIVPRARRRRKDREAGLPPPSPPRRSYRGVSDRGLSPVRYYADGDGEESTSPAESPWLPSPSPMRKTPCRRRVGLGLGAPGAGVSGFSLCVSPLVRPSVGRHLRGGHPPDAVVAGELRPSPLHPLTSSATLHHCRSWKLADGGRFR